MVLHLDVYTTKFFGKTIAEFCPAMLLHIRVFTRPAFKTALFFTIFYTTKISTRMIHVRGSNRNDTLLSAYELVVCPCTTQRIFKTAQICSNNQLKAVKASRLKADWKV